MDVSMTPCKKQPKPTNIKYYNSNSAVSLHFFTEKSQLSISVCIVVCRENNRIMNNVRINSVFCILTTVNLLLPHPVYILLILFPWRSYRYNISQVIQLVSCKEKRQRKKLRAQSSHSINKYLLSNMVDCVLQRWLP